jgi:drug/metabolite transporter (DMT)-like permease
MKKGYFFALIAVTIWAISSGLVIPLIKVSSFTLYSLGSFFGSIALFLLLVFKKRLKSSFKYSKKTFFYLLITGLGVTINNSLFFFALKTGSVANASLTHYLAPIFVALIFAPLILKEKLTLKKFLLVLLSFLGLFILTVPSFKGLFDAALLYGSLSAVFFALFTALAKKTTQIQIDPLTTTFYITFIPCIILSPFAVSSVIHGIAIKELLLLVFWGALLSAMSNALFLEGIKRIPAVNASILGYIEPLGAIVLAFIFLGQPINIYVIVGGILIVVSGILIIKNYS